MLIVPERLAATCHGVPERSAWLERLPHVVRELQARWTLSLGAAFDHSEVSCAWVAPAVRGDGTRAVLKLGMPHMEAAHEIQALRLWDGDPTVRLLESDADLNAMNGGAYSTAQHGLQPAAADLIREPPRLKPGR